jgi:hypothetical protein
MSIKKLPLYCYWIFFGINIILFFSSVYFFYEAKMSMAMYMYIAITVISSFLVFSNIKTLSDISFFLMLPISFLILASSAIPSEGILADVTGEKYIMIILALSIVFFLINCTHWIISKDGWRKIVSIIFVILSLLIATLFGLMPTDYYQNFIYTRLFVLILFVFCLFISIKTKKFMKFLGILGIFASIGILFFSAMLFSIKVYTVEGEDKEKIIENIDSKAREMLGYYNDKDVDNFCKYCAPDLVAEFQKDTTVITNMKDSYGGYTEIGEVDIKSIGTTFYVQYPILLENSDTQYYFILTLMDTDSAIYGFAINTEKY